MKRTILNLFKIGLASTILVFSSLVTAEPPNLTLLRKEIKNYHDSGMYQKELNWVLQKANNYVVAVAKANKQRKNPLKLALVLDIDETSLSNYDFMAKRDFVGTSEQVHHEIMAANSPAIKSTLALYHDALKYGVKVFFITGRNESERDATQTNLKNIGYTQWSGLYLRPVIYKYPSIVPFKSQARANIVKKGYTIIATIGDQFSDLEGGYAEKGFKLPNPYYYLP